MPLFLIKFFAKNKLAKKHPFPASSIIHRKRGTVLFEIEFNWYDENFLPISLVRQTITGKKYSISYYELLEFKEYAGVDSQAGTTIENYGKEKK